MKNQYVLKVDENALELELDPVSSSNFNSQYDEPRGGTASGVEKRQLRKILSILRRNWLMILLINLLVTVAAIVYVAQKAEYFKAEAIVQVNTETNPAIGGKSGSSVVVTSSGNDPVYFTTQLQIIESPGLLRRVVKTLDLEHNQAFLRPNSNRKLTVWQNVLRFFGLYKLPPRPPVETVENNSNKNTLNLSNKISGNLDEESEKLAPYVATLKRGLNVTPVKDTRTANKETRLIEIEFTHQEPHIAAKVVNTIADSYVLMNLEQKVESNATAGDFLQKRVADLQAQIRGSEEKLINYSRDNQILSLDGNQNTVVQKLTDLNMKLGQALNDRIMAETAYRAAMQNPLAKVAAETKDPRAAQLEANLQTLRQRLAQLLAEYTDEWQEVINVRSEIAKLEKELEPARRRAAEVQLATLEQAYREAVSRENELRRNFEKQRGEVLTQNEAAINYRIIQQEIETNKTLLDGLLQRSKENDLILNGTPNNVSVIDRALTPRSPLGLQTNKDILIAFLGSLAFGFAIAFVRDWFDDTIRNSDDFEQKLNLPLLAAIPSTASSGYLNKLFGFRTKQNSLLGGQTRIENTELAESYVQLRTFLLLADPVRAPRTILITSADAGEGKTTTALNLAKTLTEFSEKVLLIDADLRLPQLHLDLNLTNQLGISALLTNQKFDDEIVKATIQQVDNSNLYLLSAGPQIKNSVNLLGSMQMRRLLNYLSQEYSYIIIDSPPVLYFSDSLMLATVVDGVILIIRENVSQNAMVQQTKRLLQGVNASIAGIALNATTTHKTARKHRYKYYRQQIENQNSDFGQSTLKIK